MLPFRRILVPVDYSEPCKAIAPAVKAMAAHFGSEVLLLHSYYLPMAAYNELSLVEMISPVDVQQSEEKRLAEFGRQTYPDLAVRGIVEQNDAGTAIHNAVKREGVDLIMMPTSGRGPIRKLLLGSVTSKVLHDVSCPVWTGVHRGVEGKDLGCPVRKILCAVTTGDEAPHVIRAASLLAEAFDAKFSILHAVDAQHAVLDIEAGPYVKAVLDAATDRLNGILHEMGTTAPVTVMEGDVAKCIRQEALARDADLVITGRGHAHGALSRLWSHLSEIVRESPCPVLSL